ncbi:MerR family transcriptional regulator [Rhodospirillaceae bacterium KN72]|uniref:MerR family transcriptional regulator n=1 Tax=Pacificispira spongiicola TaxID=2729598 RepID=A0A7Y0E0C1_9PROT|nr:MerR family transcriptional regulator [Pacificispira spongiicola]NMM44905.1 MerR family transcriptional regulator [Pacificispira spongiicola]
MRISEAADACGLSADTIRYYEKSGMIPPIRRDASGRRRFSAADIDWLTLIYWLRETGMPLRQMRRFFTLAQGGPETIPERRQILTDHASELQRRRENLDKCDAVLAIKIASYDQPKPKVTP